MNHLHTKSITDLIELLDQKKITSVDIINDLFHVIDKNDQKIGAYLYLNKKQILNDAIYADQQRRKGIKKPLLGIPITIKDLINVKDDPCTCSSKILKDYISPYDATVITKLKDAGAILFGRVNMDEFAMGSSTENAALGATSNPWNTDYVPGGSSGGSAACVGGNLAIASLGSDTGGSIRQPASFCGCIGLKPTYGRVSRYGLTAFASSLDQIGPLTKTVKDAALLIDIISGKDIYDSTITNNSPTSFFSSIEDIDSLNGIRIGLPKEYFIKGMDNEVQQAINNAVEKYKSLGAKIIDVSLPHSKYAIAVYYIIATAEASANLARFDGIRYGQRENTDNLRDLYKKTRSAGLGDEVKRRIILGTYVLSSGYYDAYYNRAQKVRSLIKNDFSAVFKKCDVLLSPVSPTTAYLKGEKINDPLKMYLDDILTTSVNLAGNCAIALPCGFSSNNLPIGMQLIGDYFREDLILKTAYLYEKYTDWSDIKPEIIE